MRYLAITENILLTLGIIAIIIYCPNWWKFMAILLMLKMNKVNNIRP